MTAPRKRAPLSPGEWAVVLVILAFLAILCLFVFLAAIAGCVALLRFIGWAI